MFSKASVKAFIFCFFVLLNSFAFKIAFSQYSWVLITTLLHNSNFRNSNKILNAKKAIHNCLIFPMHNNNLSKVSFKNIFDVTRTIYLLFCNNCKHCLIHLKCNYCIIIYVMLIQQHISNSYHRTIIKILPMSKLTFALISSNFGRIVFVFFYNRKYL